MLLPKTQQRSQLTAGSLKTCQSALFFVLLLTSCVSVDTIWYGRLTCALKLTRWPAHGTETKKNKGKIKQKLSSSEETVQAIVYEGSLDNVW